MHFFSFIHIVIGNCSSTMNYFLQILIVKIVYFLFFSPKCDCRIVYDKLKKMKIMIVKCSFVHD
jgi:hypothetical protein